MSQNNRTNAAISNPGTFSQVVTSPTRSEEIGKARRIISWNTTKTAEGFGFKVYEVLPRTEPNAEGRYADTAVLKVGTRATRAQAKGLAQKWCRYLKTQVAA